MARKLFGLALAMVCLPPAPLLRAAQANQQDTPALAAALLAVPAAERPRLLEQRGAAPTPALVDALLTIGNRKVDAGDLDTALDCYEYTLALAKSLDDQLHMGETLLGLGQVYGRRADYDRSHAVTSEALDIATRLADDALATAALNNLGIISRLQGDYDQARTIYRRVLAMADAAHRDDQMARALTNIGIVETYQGMYDAAVADLQQSLELGTTLKNDQVVVNAHLNLGNVYYFQNNCALALEFYERVMNDARRIGNATATLSALNNISVCERANGRLDASMTHLRRALAMAEQRNLPAEVARVHYGMGEIYARQGRFEEALAEHTTSLKAREAIGDRLGIAESMVSMAETLLRSGDAAAALERARRGAALADEIDLPEVAFGARTAEGNALVALDRPAEAETALRDAIRRAEASRSRIAGTGVDRARYLADATEPYVALASLLGRTGRELDSLIVAEQAHARALGEVLSGRPADDVLTDAERLRQRDLQKRLGTLNRQIQAASSSPSGSARVKELVAARQTVRLEQDRLESALYAAHPELRLRYGAPPLLDAATLSRRLDRSTAVIEYVEGVQATLMLVATAGPAGPVVRAHAIPVRATDLDARIAAFTTAIASRDLAVASEAKALGTLLLAPALTAGKSRLVIVPYGSLWTLPFQALRTAAGRYVAEDYVVSYAPSVVALQLLADRGGRLAPTRAFLGVADPDPAHPLPEARRQVETLTATMSGAALVGSAATEAAVRRAIVAARVVHIASHGVFEDASPLYSHVVLAPGGRGDTSDDGRLEAWELMQLPLRASLVVLAACESGRGSIHGGEGAIGLSWAALAAGAPAAVVSLWRVDETATGAWMSAFYRSWPRAGATRAAAEAARTLLASERYRHPFYWASFVVIGDPAAAPARPSLPAPAVAAPRPKGSRPRP